MSFFVSYCHSSYLYMYVSCSGSITSVGEERAFSNIVYLKLCGL